MNPSDRLHDVIAAAVSAMRAAAPLIAMPGPRMVLETAARDLESTNAEDVS